MLPLISQAAHMHCLASCVQTQWIYRAAHTCLLFVCVQETFSRKHRIADDDIFDGAALPLPCFLPFRAALEPLLTSFTLSRGRYNRAEADDSGKQTLPFSSSSSS